MGGPRGRSAGFRTPTLHLDLPKRHLSHIQHLFYQIFRYFVKQKSSPMVPCVSLVVECVWRVFLVVYSCWCVRVLMLVWLLPRTGVGATPRALLAAIAPNDTAANEQTLQQILPPVMLAVKAVTDPDTGMLPGWNITLIHRNSECSSTTGPLAAYELHKDADAFLGPVCDYVIAPVARYAGRWKLPILTAGAQVDHFMYKTEFPTLTRMMGSYVHVGKALLHILQKFNWSVAGLLYYNYPIGSNKGNSKCHFTLQGVFMALGARSAHLSFNDTMNYPHYLELLRDLSKKARIMVVCADPLTVREIMLAAEELNMIDSGEYVFFNIELFNSMNRHNPWYVKEDSEDRNKRARKAYTALLTVTARTPNNEAGRLARLSVQ